MAFQAGLSGGSYGAGHQIVLVDVERIRPTEEVNQDRVDALATEMSASGFWTHPVLLEESMFAVMDGHHRYAAARRIGLRSVPAVLVSYDDPRIRLEAWRPGDAFTPDDVKHRASTGSLLPYKSTRHITEFPIPQVRISMERLHEPGSHGVPLSPAAPHPSRVVALTPYDHRFTARMGIRADAASNIEVETPETQVPHPMLRRMLQADPAMAALLPVAPGRIVLGGLEDSPFFLKRSGLLRLPPTLLADPGGLAAAARWGLEASHLQANGLLTTEAVHVVVTHGMGLLANLPVSARELILEQVPEQIRFELVGREGGVPSSYLLAWQMSRIEALMDLEHAPAADRFPDPIVELSEPLERILVAGGDSRLAVDPRTGFNRYGTMPRPRPEAVQFSSSTASSISDHGFAYCDMLRRDLVSAKLREDCAYGQLRARASDSVAAALLELVRLGSNDADVVLAPSGTDAELLTVLVSLAHGERGLTNIIVSPHETGSGVKDAGAGRYFDTIAASGAPVRRGEVIWPDHPIRFVEVSIRDAAGHPIRAELIFDDLKIQVSEALARGDRVLIHLLASSKTGLSRPSEDEMAALTRLAPERVDVVVDACQMRTRFENIGDWVRRGWLVQITGSKFLTGPPFSGALLMPPEFRERQGNAARLLASAPGIGLPEDWTGAWRAAMSDCPPGADPSFGTIFRWVPALLEAKLLEDLPRPLLRYGFDRFRTAVHQRLARSHWLDLIDDGPADLGSKEYPALATTSIVSVTVSTIDWNGYKRHLSEQECRKLFTLLNLDISNQLGRLSSTEEALAKFQAHIGQPVVLGRGERGDRTVLRLVLGARFFNIIGHAGPGSVEAALESQIADAFRAIEKLELLASRWTRLPLHKMG